MKNNNFKLTLRHPVCNLIYGERLYYLLINVSNNLFDAREKLMKALKDADGLFESSCAYFVFGESDILLRIWASEVQLAKFRINFEQQLGKNVIEIQEFLIGSQDTWFQREIENETPDWGNVFADGGAASILKSGEVPKCLIRQVDPINGVNSAKFFLFVHEQFGVISDLFGELKSDLRLQKPELLAGFKRISIYRYLTQDHRGVLIKAEAPGFQAASKQLVALAERLKDEKYSAHTTTYFCAEHIKPESDAVINKGRVGLHHVRPACEELLISHDCNRRKWGKSRTTELRVNKMTDILVARFGELFEQDNLWEERIEDLRKIQRWIVRQSNEQLRGFLIDYYITLEKTFRELFKPRRDLWKDTSKLNELSGKLSQKLSIDNARMRSVLVEVFAGNSQTEDFMLRDIRACVSNTKATLGKAAGQKEMDDTQRVAYTKSREILADFLLRLERKGGPYQGGHNIIENRNDLMHGNIRDLFEASEGEQRWVNFVENYLLINLALPRVVPSIELALQSQSEEGGFE